MAVSEFISSFLGYGPPAQTEPIEVALTVDDLPLHENLFKPEEAAEIVGKMLEVCVEEKVADVCGFVNGLGVTRYPMTRDVLQAWVKAGFSLGNHTYSHLDNNAVGVDEFLDDVRTNEVLIRDLGYEVSPKYFRYPYLNEGHSQQRRDEIRKWLEEQGYVIAQPTVDFSDWVWNRYYLACLENSLKPIEFLKESYLGSALQHLHFAVRATKLFTQAPVKQILILHASSFTAIMLRDLIRHYRENSVRFISLKEAMSDPFYAQNPNVLVTHGRTFLGQLMLARGLRSPRIPSVQQALLTTVLSTPSFLPDAWAVLRHDISRSDENAVGAP